MMPKTILLSITMAISISAAQAQNLLEQPTPNESSYLQTNSYPLKQPTYRAPKPPPLEKWQKYQIRKGLATLSDFWTPPPLPVGQDSFFESQSKFQVQSPQQFQAQSFEQMQLDAAQTPLAVDQVCAPNERSELENLIRLKDDMGGIIPFETYQMIDSLQEKCGL